MRAARRILLPVFLGVAAALLGLAPSAAAQPSSVSGTSCYIVLNKVQPGATFSDVVAQGCNSSGARPQAAAADASVVIATVYQNTNYGGKSFVIYGAQGPCDALGYSIRDMTNINDVQVSGISSYTTASKCNGSRVYNQTQLAGTPASFSGYNVPSVGANYDNRVYSMKLYNLFDQP